MWNMLSKRYPGRTGKAALGRSAMLVIRQEQMDAMRAAMFERFVANMVAHLRTAYPEHTRNHNDESMRKFVKDSVQRAHAFNVRAADNLETFLAYTTCYGLDFYTMPDYQWAQVILENDMIDETEKLNRINEHFVFSEGFDVV